MFQEKRIVITGASSGLGRALGLRFIREGAHLALIARDPEKLETVRNELLESSTPNQQVERFSCDVADAAATENAIQEIAKTMGPPDILINSAGILREGPFEKLPLSTFQETLAINYFGVIHCIQAVLPFFQKQGAGRIVNIASLGGKMSSYGYAAYCSSKFALVGLSETLRMELKPQNIKVHLVCPGEFDSPMVDALNQYRSNENRAVTQTVPVLPLDVVADEIMAGIRKDRYLIIPGKAARLLERLGRYFPAITRWVVDDTIRKASRRSAG